MEEPVFQIWLTGVLKCVATLIQEDKLRMKYHVLHLIGCNLVGGPEKQILHHAKDMQNSDYEIAVGTFHDGSRRPEILVAAEQMNIATVCLPGGVRPDLVSHLSRELRKRKGWLLCTHGFKANVVGYLASRITGTPHIAFVRGFTAENTRIRFYEMLERQALRRAERVVCVSRKQAEEIARLRPRRRPPIVVKNAMLPPYDRALDREPVSRASLGIAPDAFVFGSVGRLSPEKGHRFMVNAFQQLCAADSKSEMRLIVVGDGVEQGPLEQQASQLGIQDRVHFAGYQGNPAEWMRLFDCMVQPSLTEGTPNSVLEALCLRVPVVATSVGGVPDLIVDGQNGLLAPPADAAKLADAMRRMESSAELRRRLSAGSEELTREYSPAYQRQRFVEIYEDIFQLQR